MAQEISELVGKDIHYFEQLFGKIPPISKAVDISDDVPNRLSRRKVYLLYFFKEEKCYVIIVDIQEDMLIYHKEFLVSSEFVADYTKKEFSLKSGFLSHIARVHMGFNNPEDFIQLIMQNSPK